MKRIVARRAKSKGKLPAKPGLRRALAKPAPRRAAISKKALPDLANAKPKARPRRLSRAVTLQILERLTLAIPRPHVELLFENPWQLLIAVILSAQSTDRRVNQVTPELFRRWPTPLALAAAAKEDVEERIKSTGFFRNKTKAIVGASAMLVERFGGEVPRTMGELLEVPGVARKTANVVLGSAHGLASGVVVDTHAMRVARRLALSSEQTPTQIEADLCKHYPASTWIALSHRLVLHGRYVCTARSPDCAHCPLNELCPSRQLPPEGPWEARAMALAAEMERRAEGFTRV